MLRSRSSDSDGDQATMTHETPVMLFEDTTSPVERHGYRPSAGNRWVGLGGTLLIYVLVLALAGFFFTVTHVVPVKAPSALIVVDLRPTVSPPKMPPQEKEAPRPVEQKEQSEPPRMHPVERTIVPVAPISVPLPVAQPKPTDPGPVQPEAATPRTLPAPPAPQVANNAPDSWEGRVLAALNKERRYPRLAMMRHQQGVPYVRFTMDRQGKVLSSRLERGSGGPDLDHEAVALPRVRTR